ncbi:MAG: c-type cytochrome, partial [Aeromonas salmonicida]
GKSGVMPARGTCVTCSDEEIENAIHYMTDNL